MTRLCLLILLTIPWTYPRAQKSLIDSLNPKVITNTMIDEGNGIRISLRRIATRFKRPRTRTILLVHGGGSGGVSSFDFPSRNAPSFAYDLFRKGFNVYIMNVRGWENSKAPAYDSTDTSLTAGSCSEAAADIDAVVDYIRKKEQLQRVNLFGWATGGHWVSYYTTLHNEKVDRLIVLNTLYGVKAPWSLDAAFADPADSNRYNNRIPVYRESSTQAVIASRFNAIPFADKRPWVDSETVTEYATLTTSWNTQHTLKVPGGYRRESFNMSHGYQYWNAKSIKRPTLIIRSQYDFWSRPIDPTAFYNDLTNAPRRDTLTLKNATHFVTLDKPRKGRNQLLSAIDHFIPIPAPTSRLESETVMDGGGIFLARLDKATANKLYSLLDDLDIPSLKTDYEVSWTDDITGNSMIKYDHGKTKRSSDYGCIGTYGLAALYNLLNHLHTTQYWKKIAPLPEFDDPCAIQSMDPL